MASPAVNQFANAGAASAQTVTPVFPRLTQPGTCLVAFATWNYTGAPAMPAPAGWTPIGVQITSGNQGEGAWYYPNNPGGIGSVVFNLSASGGSAGVIGACIFEIKNFVSIESFTAKFSPATSGTKTVWTDSLTTLQNAHPDDLVLMFGAVLNTTAAETWSLTAPFVNDVSSQHFGEFAAHGTPNTYGDVIEQVSLTFGSATALPPYVLGTVILTGISEPYPIKLVQRGDPTSSGSSTDPGIVSLPAPSQKGTTLICALTSQIAAGQWTLPAGWVNCDVSNAANYVAVFAYFDNPGGIVSIHPTWNGTISYLSACIYEFTNIGALDEFGSASDGSTTPSATTPFTATDYDLVFAALEYSGNPTVTAPVPFDPTAGGANLWADPMFVNSLAADGLTIGAGLASATPADLDYQFEDYATSLKIIATATAFGSGETISGFPAATAGNTYSMGCFVRRADGSAVTTSDVHADIGSGAGDTELLPVITNIGNGLFRCVWANHTVATTAASVLRFVKDGTNDTYYVTGFFFVTGATAPAYVPGPATGAVWTQDQWATANGSSTMTVLFRTVPKRGYQTAAATLSSSQSWHMAVAALAVTQAPVLLEQYHDQQVPSTLSAGITATATSLSVASAISYPPEGQFRILIDNELIIVKSVSGTTFSNLIRGVEGTTAAAHSASAIVEHVLSAGSLLAIANRFNQHGAFSSLPLAGTPGRLFMPYDGVSLYRDNGYSWDSYGLLSKHSEPDLSRFTWVNQGDAVVDTIHGGLFITCQPQVATTIRALVKPLPLLNVGSLGIFSAVTRIRPLLWGRQYQKAGVCWYESSSGKLETAQWTATPTVNIEGSRWNSVTSYNNSIIGIQAATLFEWFRLRSDGTTRYIDVSIDGINWLNLWNEPWSDGFTSGPDNYGFFIDTQSGTTSPPNMGLQILSWSESSA